MAVRALVIAIESYPDIKGGHMEQPLEGTLEAGREFRTWLIQKWDEEGIPESDRQLIFCSEPAEPYGSGATIADLRDALLSLRHEGQNATRELFIFYSGHGFSFQENGERADAIIASDFRDADHSSDCCVNLDEMIRWLRVHLGSGRHYYFIDACRNQLTPHDAMTGRLLRDGPRGSTEPSIFVLQSAGPGDFAPADGPFAAALRAGLRGAGKAKTWDAAVTDGMVVRYDSLRTYVKAATRASQRVYSRATGIDGETDAILARLRPVPTVKCTIKIRDAGGFVRGKVAYRQGRARLVTERALLNLPFELVLEPDSYAIWLQLDDGFVVSPRDPISIDLYEDVELDFRLTDQELVASDLPLLAIVEATVPDGAVMTLKNTITAAETSIAQSGRVQLDPGHYLANLESHDDGIFAHQEIELTFGSFVALDLSAPPSSVPHRSIAERLHRRNGGLDFSTSLEGTVRDPDLNLWLALLGGLWILAPLVDASGIAAFPFRAFHDEKPDAPPIYVLAGFENAETTLKVALPGKAEDVTVIWTEARHLHDMAGLREAYFETAPGSHLVSFRVANQAPYTLATFTSANFATLITLTLDPEGRPCVSQYLLPLGHLVGRLPASLCQKLVGRKHLKDLRLLVRALRAFRDRRDVRASIPETALEALVRGEWLDPIGLALAGYEAVRRGRRDQLAAVVRNMQSVFPDFPDTAALTRMNREPVAAPAGAPLFLDGWESVMADRIEAAGSLDFASPWTAWRR